MPIKRPFLLALILHSAFCILHSSASSPPAPPATTQPAAAPLRAWPVCDTLALGAIDPGPWYLTDATPLYTAEQIPPLIWEINGKPEYAARLVGVLDFARQVRPDVMVCRYTSACTTWLGDEQFALTAFTPRRMLKSDEVLSVTWSGQPLRPYIDLRKRSARDAVWLHATREATDAGLGAVALDNITLDQGVPPIMLGGLTKNEWDSSQIALLREGIAICHRNGLRLIVNAAADPHAHWHIYSDYVDGLLYEMPLHPNVLADEDRIDAELAAYDAALAGGKYVGLFPMVYRRGDFERDDVARARHARLVAAALMLVREPGQACGVCDPSYRPPTPRDWWTWPTSLGEPAGPYTRDGSRRSRVFAGGVLTVDFALGQIDITAAATN